MKQLRRKIHLDPEGIGNPNLDDPEIQSQFNTIFDKIRQHPELEDLRLDNNWMRAQELNRLAEVIENHKELQILDLSYDDISVEGVPGLKKIISDHPKLEYLYLDFNHMHDELVNALVRKTEQDSDDLMQRIKSIKISLSNNNFLTTKSIEDTQDKLSTNSRLTMLVGNQIRIEDDDEYRAKIIKQGEISLGKTTTEPEKTAPTEKTNAAPTQTFTPLKDSNAPSLKRKAEDSPEKIAFKEEIDQLDHEEFHAALPGLKSAIEMSKKQKVSTAIKAN